MPIYLFVKYNKNILTQIKRFTVHSPVWGPTNSRELFRNANHLLEIASVSGALFLKCFLVWIICEITCLNSPWHTFSFLTYGPHISEHIVFYIQVS